VVDIDTKVDADCLWLKVTHKVSVFALKSELKQIDQNLPSIERHATQMM
jgi:hypothetical protein